MQTFSLVLSLTSFLSLAHAEGEDYIKSWSPESWGGWVDTCTNTLFKNNHSNWPLNELSLKKRGGRFLVNCCNPAGIACQNFDRDVWQRLQKDFIGSNVIFVSVDTSVKKTFEVCQHFSCEKGSGGRNSIKEPCIAHLDKETGVDGARYKGKMKYEDMKKFVKKTLKGIERSCTVQNIAVCTKSEKAILEEWTDKSVDEIKPQLAALEAKLSEPLKPEERYSVSQKVSIYKSLIKSKTEPAGGDASAPQSEAKEDL